ncbi:hypothetical protein [Janibacter cremeus]|uniref:Uncharacterized protein n=1 Tax=Janibacter cremeus TaxID=1285192 RepID=A0A852VJ45_9MICO|nr:hypothetical protein [Janibacter cremeus]NYF97127.1 hypothetical protein [Janibacter cremeus]
MDVLTAALIFTLVGAWLAALGRQAQPRVERVPVGEWRLRDVVANIVIGYSLLVAAQERMRYMAVRRDQHDG